MRAKTGPKGQTDFERGKAPFKIPASIAFVYTPVYTNVYTNAVGQGLVSPPGSVGSQHVCHWHTLTPETP